MVSVGHTLRIVLYFDDQYFVTIALDFAAASSEYLLWIKLVVQVQVVLSNALDLFFIIRKINPKNALRVFIVEQ